MPVVRSCFRLSALAGAAALSLSACNASDGARSARDGRSDRHVAAGEQVVTGNATFRERLRLPPDSMLVVQLLELPATGESTQATALSNVRLVNVQGPSIPFALPYDPTQVEDDGRYGLRARLSSPEGDLLFATEAPVAVEPGRSDPIVFDLAYVAPRPTHWQCGPLRVDARFDPLAESVTLAFSGRRLQLPLAISGSGARYADQAGNEFWTKGDAGTLTLEGEAQPGCVRTEAPSPWSEAAARGVAYRAVGNEPGWWVEVDRGEAPALRAVLDYGERGISVDHAQPAGLGFTGQTAGGTEVVLEITRESCQDVMSGERFGTSATLMVGDRRYQGCGEFLPIGGDSR
jgi:uncharacterized lipoprotein YbaY/uncharacterized membrane protein